MKYLSVCSGIEAATTAWHRFGWEPVGFSEIEPFPSAVLKHRFPEVKNYGDMTKYKEWDIERGSIDILVGGTPCQSFSVAGLRKGLTDPRGNLMLTYGAIANHFRPRWIVWENVPGVLSSNKGRDFGTFLGMLAELGYGFAYRVLDAQYIRVESHERAVPQRRRRVFVVGYLGDWRRSASVLFESESMSRYTPPSRKTGERAAGNAKRSTGNCCEVGDTLTVGANQYSGFIGEPVSEIKPEYFEHHPNDSRVEGPNEVGNTVSARYGTGGGNTPLVNQPYKVGNCLTQRMHKGINSTLDEGQTPVLALAGNTIDRKPENGGNGKGFQEDVSYTLTSVDKHAVAFAQNSRDELREMEVAGALSAQPGMKQTSYVRQEYRVRRLTPKECARLQGFPDDWAKIPWRGKPAEKCPDGPQYKAYGNSMATNVMEWIGSRIVMESL